MEKADIQKSLIIFNCFALSWSDVRVTQLVRGSVFQVKSPFSLNEGHGYTACWWTQACPCSVLPDVKHLENGLVLKREQLWRAISWLFQQSKIKPKRKKKTNLKNPEELKAGWPHPQLARSAGVLWLCPGAAPCPFHSQKWQCAKYITWSAWRWWKDEDVRH